MVTLKRLFGCLLLLILPLFFMGDSPGAGRPVVAALWNYGHVLFFGLLAWLLFESGSLRHLAPRKRCGRVMLLVLLFGVAIESVQGVVGGRMASVPDLLLDIIGAAAVLSLLLSQSQPVWRNRWGLRLLALFFVLVSFGPLLEVAYQEYMRYCSFPVLADFEDRKQPALWQGDARVRRVTAPVRAGNYSLEIAFSTARYSKLELQHLRGDWSQAAAIAFSVYNPGPPLTLHYRIHDREHEKGDWAVDDRFNDSTLLGPGWNDIFIPRADIAAGPAHRQLDMQTVRAFQLFVIQQDKPRIVFFDELRVVLQKP